MGVRKIVVIDDAADEFPVFFRSHALIKAVRPSAVQPGLNAGDEIRDALTLPVNDADQAIEPFS